MFELSNFKHNLSIETYLLNLPLMYQRLFSKLRCRNNQPLIETGTRHNIPRDMRYWTFCETREIGDEYHYILICKFLQASRIHQPTKCLKNG